MLERSFGITTAAMHRLILSRSWTPPSLQCVEKCQRPLRLHAEILRRRGFRRPFGRLPNPTIRNHTVKSFSAANVEYASSFTSSSLASASTDASGCNGFVIVARLSLLSLLSDLSMTVGKASGIRSSLTESVVVGCLHDEVGQSRGHRQQWHVIRHQMRHVGCPRRHDIRGDIRPCVSLAYDVLGRHRICGFTG